jgi:septal ring factor EnvC (AmiA/AmiB activator)
MTEQWPIWAVLVVVLAREFKPQLAALLPESIRTWAAKRAEAHAAEQLREIHHEDVLTEMVVTKDEWIQGKLAEEITSLRKSNDTLTAEVFRNTNALNRNTDLLTTAINRNSEVLTLMNSNLTRLVDLVQDMPKPPGWIKRG